MAGIAPDAPTASFPKPANLVRTANLARQGQRPQDPTNLQFQLAMDFVPADFLIKDITVGDSQAIWRQCQSLGLAVPYTTDLEVQACIRKLMSLPFLPQEHIAATFAKLKTKITEPLLTQLFDYVQKTWLDSNVWPPANWSIFQHSIRTNNDVEGWHRRLNCKAGRAGLQLYKLIPLLPTEAKLITLQMILVRESKMCRNQRWKTRQLEGCIFKLWGDYAQGTIKTSALLAACSHLHGPAL
ncbi:uncharacterized protein LOC119724038 [Patiria miniata]|uniref:MULE transposase domain-containing protein n=1 Tax=Patiria miniata TaxID=46514 RepID=A0A913ZGH9_PATMI|nr:uncharacterized protein LOC119724038 [Patiria miniata]